MRAFKLLVVNTNILDWEVVELYKVYMNGWWMKWLIFFTQYKLGGGGEGYWRWKVWMSKVGVGWNMIWIAVQLNIIKSLMGKKELN